MTSVFLETASGNLMPWLDGIGNLTQHMKLLFLGPPEDERKGGTFFVWGAVNSSSFNDEINKMFIC